MNKFETLNRPTKGNALESRLLMVGAATVGYLAYASGLSEYTTTYLESLYMNSGRPISDEVSPVVHSSIEILTSCLYGSFVSSGIEGVYKTISKNLYESERVRITEISYKWHPGRLWSQLR